MVDVLRPETTTTIKVSEKTKKPMTYTLAIVDEGLLDLTNFKTPDPWNHFNAREALGVKTVCFRSFFTISISISTNG